MGKYYYLYTKEELRKGGRTIAKMSMDKFLDKIYDFVKKNNDGREIEGLDKKRKNTKFMACQLLDAVRILAYDKKSTIYKDFKGINPDWENYDIIDNIKTYNGCPYIIADVGGDWEIYIYIFIYYDGSTFRVYIPKKGNAYRTDCKRLLGNFYKENKDYPSDDDFVYKQLLKDGTITKDTDKHGISDKVESNLEMCKQDFESRMTVKSVKESLLYKRLSMGISKALKESLNI